MKEPRVVVDQARCIVLAKLVREELDIATVDDNLAESLDAPDIKL